MSKLNKDVKKLVFKIFITNQFKVRQLKKLFWKIYLNLMIINITIIMRMRKFDSLYINLYIVIIFKYYI